MLQASARRRHGSRFLIAGFLAVACLAVGAMRPATAGANIPYPYEFMPYIEGVSYQGQSTCVSAGTHWPGVMGFRDLLNFWFGAHEAQDWRACNVGDQSEHKESRALDYFVNARTDPATTLKILAWILEKDQYGNNYARARRLGIMYVISNGRMFRFYDPGRGWTQQSGCPASDPGSWDQTHCHVNHIHFSFSWAGAKKQTSWWTTVQQTRKGCNSTLQTWVFASPYGPLVQIKRISDAYGNVYDTQSEIKNSYWRVRAGGQEYRANQPLSTLANPRPQAMLPTSLGPCLFNLT